MSAPIINLKDFTYELPEEKIATSPCTPRDASKLLYYNKGEISDFHFHSLPQLLVKGLMVFNNTKVIPARMIFYKSTGAKIEVFLLEPFSPTTVVALAMESTENIQWRCMIGNLKKWKEGDTIEVNIVDTKLKATLVNKTLQIVEFEWDSKSLFVDIIDQVGKLPIPPYLNRDTCDQDAQDYQTVYAQNEGAVAAPTAGLHFTKEVLDQLSQNIELGEVTLHVGAGTFQPVKETENVQNHSMHAEQFVVQKKLIEQLIQNTGKITAVGTTSMRTLESLYWLGVLINNTPNGQLFVPKLTPYEVTNDISCKEALQNLLNWMDQKQVSEIHGATEIIILPGYTFKVVNQLITNFHQPDSTLILLVAAFLGEDWRKVYNHALNHQYRFLSYGDSSFLIPKSN